MTAPVPELRRRIDQFPSQTTVTVGKATLAAVLDGAEALAEELDFEYAEQTPRRGKPIHSPALARWRELTGETS